MEKESTDFIPLLEDIETPIVSADSIYPVKKNKNKECKCKKARCVKKVLKTVLKVVFVAFLLFSAVASIAGYRWYRWMSREVERFTSTQANYYTPREEVPMGELEVLKDNAKLFWDSIQNGAVPQDFVLTHRQTNGFVAASDFLRTHAYAEMEDNELKLSVSLPTDGLPGGKGRFFNAYQTVKWHPETNRLTIQMDAVDVEVPIGQLIDAEFELTTMEDGKTLNLQVIKGKAFDHKIPTDFLEEHYNLLEDLYTCDCHDDDCKHARKFLEGLAGVSMEEGQVVVHADTDPKEATYYKEHEGHSWHHDHHGHHGKHGHHHGEHGHHHGGHRVLRESSPKAHGHSHHWRALHMVRRLMA
ncbi:unnamed protein product [Cylindrotheca closterium]|uniref:Uncharacterized protein n=1 Tax=Cylindrotheca closterium TaxID=2856 RepID=A0AAD2FS48_9STRA|nr:unnamed protein product [Cylindrotheca closterium]